MEENKNLVISYRYYVEKNDPELEEVSKRICGIMSNGPTDPAVAELRGLMHKQYALLRKQEVIVRKEYPECLVKDFKTKEELFDFIDEDEPMILKESNICFESVPDCLKEIGFTGLGNDIWDCNHYIARKHGYDYGEDN